MLMISARQGGALWATDVPEMEVEVLGIEKKRNRYAIKLGNLEPQELAPQK
jgi:hypothetical protein